MTKEGSEEMSFVRSLAFAGTLALALAPVTAEAALTHPTHNLNLRAGPGVRNRVITTIPAGSLVDIISCGSEWCYMSWGGHRGFSNGRYLVSHVTVQVSPLNRFH